MQGSKGSDVWIFLYHHLLQGNWVCLQVLVTNSLRVGLMSLLIAARHLVMGFKRPSLLNNQMLSRSEFNPFLVAPELTGTCLHQHAQRSLTFLKTAYGSRH